MFNAFPQFSFRSTKLTQWMTIWVSTVYLKNSLIVPGMEAGLLLRRSHLGVGGARKNSN